MPIKRGFQKLHAWIYKVAVEWLLQKILGTLTLVLIYFFLFGPISLFMRLFFAKKLESQPIHSNTYWVRADGYHPDRQACLQES